MTTATEYLDVLSKLRSPFVHTLSALFLGTFAFCPRMIYTLSTVCPPARLHTLRLLQIQTSKHIPKGADTVIEYIIQILRNLSTCWPAGHALCL